MPTLQLPPVLVPVFNSAGDASDDDDDDWRDFVKDYQQRFQRGPPPDGFETWLKFATENQCETRCFYESLDADLAYFRNINNKTSSLLQWDRVIPEGIQWTTL